MLHTVCVCVKFPGIVFGFDYKITAAYLFSIIHLKIRAHFRLMRKSRY